MADKEVLRKRLEMKKKALEEAEQTYIDLLSGGVKSYGVGSRNLSKLDIPVIEDTIKKLEIEIDELENKLAGRKNRKAIGVVPRDI